MRGIEIPLTTVAALPPLAAAEVRADRSNALRSAPMMDAGTGGAATKGPPEARATASEW